MNPKKRALISCQNDSLRNYASMRLVLNEEVLYRATREIWRVCPS